MAWHEQVETREWLTPGLVRIVLGGTGLSGLVVPDDTDTYVNVAIPPAGAPYGPVFDPKAVRDEHPQDLWPVRRRYTVRSWDEWSGLLTLVFEGPGGGYRPDPEADWHLMVGDESALPAIAASLEAVPAGRPVVVRLVCDGPEHQLPLTSPGDLDLRWLHRTGAADDVDALADEVSDLEFPPGRVHAFVHGEAE